MRGVTAIVGAGLIAFGVLASCGDEFEARGDDPSGAGAVPSSSASGAQGGGGTAGAGGSGGSIECAEPDIACDGACVDTSSDVQHCGGCGEPCVGANAAYECIQGSCVLTGCEDGFDDCDMDAETGCEANLAQESANCGMCGETCAAGCVDSTCRDAVQVSAGHRHTCAVLDGGSVWCWGSNSDGELGDGTMNDALKPRQVVSLPTGAISVHAGGYDSPTAGEHSHTCALLLGGIVYCWGNNDHGQLGTGDTTSSATPVEVPGINGATLVTVGGMHNCLLSSEGGTACWGLNDSKQVGDDGGDNLGPPIPSGSGTLTIDAGWENTCLITAGMVVRCQGEGSFGQNGNGIGADQSGFLPTGTGLSALQVAVGGRHTCARTASDVQCWGSDQFGQVGTEVASPTEPVVVQTVSATTVLTGGHHSAMAVGASLRVWGRGDNGQLGTGNAANAGLPIDSGIVGADHASLGTRHSCGIFQGALKCWGANDVGQLGTGKGAPELSPAPVAWP
jgi:alpha-tubulin suppressor-like RCC1 family protein